MFGNEEKMFRRLLELDTIRGPHSTGILFVSNWSNADVIKKVGTPWELWGLRSIEDKFKTSSKVLLGHNRWATQGKVNNTNAHPFELGSIIGAHNGTLTTRYSLADHAKFEVDSENIFHHMNLHGVQDTIKKLNGAFTLTWWNKAEKTLNFVRNNERPLHFAYTNDNKTIFWASEAWMITVAAFQCGVDIDRVNELPVGFHYSFSMPDVAAGNYPVVTNPTINRVELYEPPVYSRPSHSPVRGGNVSPFPPQQRTPVVIEKKEELERVVTSASASYMEYQKRMLKQVEFEVYAEAEANNQKYIQAYAVDDDRISVRCYATPDSHLWKKLLASTHTFTGMVKSFTSNGGMHLTVDLRSIMEVVEADKDTPDMYVGFQGVILDEAEYTELTAKGCAWCSTPATVDDAEDIVWIGHKDHVCGDCKEFECVQDYIDQGNTAILTGNK